MSASGAPPGGGGGGLATPSPAPPTATGVPPSAAAVAAAARAGIHVMPVYDLQGRPLGFFPLAPGCVPPPRPPPPRGHGSIAARPAHDNNGP